MEISEKRQQLRDREKEVWGEFYNLKKDLFNSTFTNKELKSKCDTAYTIWSAVALDLVELEANKNL